jgi:hypothetical protein
MGDLYMVVCSFIIKKMKLFMSLMHLFMKKQNMDSIFLNYSLKVNILKKLVVISQALKKNIFR